MTEPPPRVVTAPGALAEDPEDQARDAFMGLVQRAVDSIPEPFASQLDGVAIVIDDEPLPGQAPPGHTLFGLFEGVPRTAWGASGAPHASKITIFRRPHERAYAEPVARARAVEDTVRHEIAHHLGIDETSIRRIESQRQRDERR